MVYISELETNDSTADFMYVPYSRIVPTEDEWEFHSTYVVRDFGNHNILIVLTDVYLGVWVGLSRSLVGWATVELVIIFLEYNMLRALARCPLQPQQFTVIC